MDDNNNAQMTFEKEVALLKPKADNGDGNAAQRLADLYWEEMLAHDQDESLAELCYQYSLQAVELGETIPYCYLAALCNEGIGVKQNYADAYQYSCRYLEMYGNDTTQSTGGVKLMMGYALANGNGTQKDIPLAYAYAKEAHDILNNEDSRDLLKYLYENYPLNDDGEIDLSSHGRSMLTTILLVIGVLGSICGLVMPQIISETGGRYGVPFYVGMIINLAIYGGMLFWVRHTAWAMLAQWLSSPLLTWLFFTSVDSLANGQLSPISQLAYSQIGNILLQTLILILLQRRKKGCALPWCSLTGMRDDGRNMFVRLKDLFMAYGEGEDYRQHSTATKTFVVCCQVATALIALLGVYVGYLYITSDKSWGIDIEWKCWNSPGLWGFLSVIGFFLQFFDWQHLSYKTYDVWKDDYGNIKKIERNRDMLTEVEGSILMPLLGHLLLIPALYGAMLYYVIMGAIAVLGALIPYFVAVLAVASAWPFYKVSQHFYARRWRTILLAVWCLVVACLLLVIGSAASSSFSSKSHKEANTEKVIPAIGHATVKASVANLRTGPGTEYDFYLNANSEKMQLTSGTEVQIAEITGDWYKIIMPDQGTAYIKNTLCTDIEYYQNADSETEEIDCDTEDPDESEEESTEDVETESMQSDDETIPAITNSSEPKVEETVVEDKVFSTVEQMPSFPGGTSALNQFLSSNVRYPIVAEENGIQGTVVCSFVVEKDGSISDAKVVRSIDPSLDKEAVRVVRSMPRWMPGRQNGEPVRTKYTIPVRFRLQ